jgi:hypothetical protein
MINATECSPSSISHTSHSGNHCPGIQFFTSPIRDFILFFGVSMNKQMFVVAKAEVNLP